MKKALLIVIAMTFVSFSSFSQSYSPFQLYVGFGYAVPSGGGGVLIDIEPAYRINDQMAVGLRLETALMAKEVNDVSASISAVGSYTVNGKYYLSDSGFRPYVGLGLGIYSLGNFEIDTNGNGSGGIDVGSKFGFYPRIGFDAGHFNMNLDYNIVGKSTLEDGLGGTAGEVKNTYIGIRVGFFLFGGEN